MNKIILLIGVGVMLFIGFASAINSLRIQNGNSRTRQGICGGNPDRIDGQAWPRLSAISTTRVKADV